MMRYFLCARCSKDWNEVVPESFSDLFAIHRVFFEKGMYVVE